MLDLIDFSMWDKLRYEAVNPGRNFEILYGCTRSVVVYLDGVMSINEEVDNNFLGGYEDGWCKLPKEKKEDLWNEHLAREAEFGFRAPIKNRWRFPE